MTYFERLPTNLFYENKPPAPRRSEKITVEIFVSFAVAVHQPAASCFHVICVDQSNLKSNAIEL